MKVRLTTNTGALVHDAEIPPFNIYPDVLFWGTRVFVCEGADVGEDGERLERYAEAFAVAVVDSSLPPPGLAGLEPDREARPGRIAVNVAELDEHGATWAKYPELYRALERVRVRDLIMVTMRELGVFTWSVEHDQEGDTLAIVIAGADDKRIAERVARRLKDQLDALIVVAPNLQIEVATHRA